MSKKEKTNQLITTADLLLMFTAVIWGLNVVVVKIALIEIAPLPYNAARFTIAALLSWAVLRIREPHSRLDKNDLPIIIWLGFLGHTFYQVLFISGINLTTAGNTSLLLAIIPIWVALLSKVTGIEDIKRRTWLGIFLSFAGIFLVTVGGGKAISFAGTTRGDLMIVIGTLIFAFYTIKSKPYLQKYSPLQLSTYTMIPGAFGLLIIASSQSLKQDWAAISLKAWGGVFYSAVFALVIAYFVWNNGVKKLGPAKTAIYSNISPIIAVIAGWLVLEETLSLLQFAGAAFIIAGLYIAKSSKRQKKQGELPAKT